MTVHKRRMSMLLALFATLFSVASMLRTAHAETQALSEPENVACRPQEGRTNWVRVEWKDTNNGAADYYVYRRQLGIADWGGPITTLTSGPAGGTWTFVDNDANDVTVYQYGVTAFDADDETTIGVNEFCREPRWLGEDDDNFRMFYRLADCPDFDGKKVCTENVNDGNGDNQHVVTVLANAAAYRTLYMNSGFNDPAVYAGGLPFPLDFFPCNNGCANGDGNQFPPANFETDDYDPATGMGSQYEVEVIGHELYHKVEGEHGGGGGDPYYTWLIEGQARAAEDRFCLYGNAACVIWDNLPSTAFVSQVKNYLGKPEIGLQTTGWVNGVEVYGYNAALFWTYVMEQLTTINTEPQAGTDVLVNFWLKNEEHANNGGLKDGITTLNDALADTDFFTTSRRFKDLFQDFAVANYAKDYITNPPPAGFAKYNYKDDEPPGIDWGPVKRTVSTVLDVDDSILDTTSVAAWAARYIEIDPKNTVSAVHFEVNPLAGTPYPLYYHLLIIDNGQIVDMVSDEGTSFDYTVNNGPDYDRIALIIVGLEHAVNFDYGVNLTDGLYILSPNAQFPDPVGDSANPKKFITWLEVLDTDNQPVAGIDPADFTVIVSGTVIHPPPMGAEEALINWFYSGGRYTMVLRAPPSPGCTLCPLTVQFADYSDTEADALLYGPQPGVDNQIIIDRSGSMEGAKFEAAKGQAKVYVDSYDPGDKIGVISYNNAPQNAFPLTPWTDESRIDAQNALENLPDPNGSTAIGAALREGMQKLVDQDSPNPIWNMVLLSDGKDTVDDENDHITQFISEYNARKKDAAGLQVPGIDVIAVGDDADGTALQRVSDTAGGRFEFLPEPAGASAASANALTPNAHALQLAEIYRVFAEGTLGEQQIYAAQDAITNAQTKTHIVLVDGSASQAIFALSYVYGDCPIGINVTVRRPDNTPLGPATVSNSGHFLWRVASPGPGNWKVEVAPIIPGAAASAVPDVCGEDSVARTDFLVEAALVSDVTLNAFLGLLPEERFVGKPMPIFALLSDHVPLPGANVQATVETTGEIVQMYDDGMHNDGAANDGVYAGLILDTFHGGGYPVVVDAIGNSPLNGDYVRRARLSFFLTVGDDDDDDKVPDWWEDEYPCVDSAAFDSGLDVDQDGLISAHEFTRHTNPCDADTDDGGESDGSEVQHNRNPLYAPDDFMDPPTGVAWPSVDQVVLRLGDPNDSSKVTVYRAALPEGPYTPLATDVTGDTYIDKDVENGKQYCYRVTTVGLDATSAPSDVTCTTPRQDPFPPHGELFLPQGMGSPVPSRVALVVEAFDDPYTEEHPVFDGALLTRSVPSGVVQMQISMYSDFRDAVWVPYKSKVRWTFAPGADGLATVFVRFMDGAGNVSATSGLTAVVDPDLPPLPNMYLPFMYK